MPAAFAAQFSLQHAGWLITYPVSGWLGTTFGTGVCAVTLGLVATGTTVLAAAGWAGTPTGTRDARPA